MGYIWGGTEGSGADVNRITLEWHKQWLLHRKVVVHGVDAMITDANAAEILF